MKKDSFWLALILVLGTLFGIVYFINPELVRRILTIVHNFITSEMTVIWNKIQTFGMK